MGDGRVEWRSLEHWVLAADVRGGDSGQAEAVKASEALGFHCINSRKLLEIVEGVLVHIYWLKLEKF